MISSWYFQMLDLSSIHGTVHPILFSKLFGMVSIIHSSRTTWLEQFFIPIFICNYQKRFLFLLDTSKDKVNDISSKISLKPQGTIEFKGKCTVGAWLQKAMVVKLRNSCNLSWDNINISIVKRLKNYDTKQSQTSNRDL